MSISAAISFDRTLYRLNKSDTETAKRLGFPQTLRGRALVTKYTPDLAAVIADAWVSRHGSKGATLLSLAWFVETYGPQYTPLYESVETWIAELRASESTRDRIKRMLADSRNMLLARAA